MALVTAAEVALAVDTLRAAIDDRTLRTPVVDLLTVMRQTAAHLDEIALLAEQEAIRLAELEGQKVEVVQETDEAEAAKTAAVTSLDDELEKRKSALLGL